MRRKHFCTIASALLLLTLAACSNPIVPDHIGPTATSKPTITATSTPTATCAPTDTPAPTATPTATPTPTPIPTDTPTPVPTGTPTPVPTNTPTPAPTATPTPTNTPTPQPTSTPTPVPTNTPTPRPRPTSTPTPLPTSTPTPQPANTPAPESADGFPTILDKENTILDHPVLTSEAEANHYFFRMVLDHYYQFGILAEDISMLHTKEEYLQLYPEILELEVDSLTKYHNGYYLRFSNVKTTQTDLAYHYALRTGDTSFLTENEEQAYHKLFQIAKDLQLDTLSDIDAIIAAHDYLVLNTAYDEITFASGIGGVSHYTEGTLLNGMAVCSGYASSFQLLMKLAGISCEYVWNDTHAWNLVQVGDNWYHIDVTWDDPTPDTPGVVNYKHFMMTDEEISQLKEHTSWTCECGGPHNCDDTTYRLYPYRDFICSNETEASNLMLAQNDENIISLIYPVNGSLTEDSLLQLAFSTLNISGTINYYPSELLGDTHYLLRIIAK